MVDCSSSLWRMAYVAAIFETDPAKRTLNMCKCACRQISAEKYLETAPLRLGGFEHEAIEAAQLRLATLKAQPVEVVKLALVAGNTPT